ncbi:4-hydroxy-tetrahydrodipicolinate synthase [Planctellipticum variicoloris]|uniref:4-hydroxy-tetrahydrodipicolinate synthase n=1 Tax=Planctellipticum variicoloris TaxID=3064265 RepID=UPI002BFF528D|nr:4-hydroxy-tetrahydrodipicolinate synthase [Planctomycetaceae bacterium SH412]HTN02105.1 4-hydroxy-tetrahydrodipicolinate synthase [Planctomycetaceae bacterium]
MQRKGEQFAGLTVAIVTPFKNGHVDEAGLKQLVDFHVAAGTNGLCPVGTTGESPTLTHEEHNRVIGIVCQHAAGRIKVMAGTGSNSTSEAIEMTKFAKSVGADGAMMVAPYYNKPTGEGFYQHYRAVAEAVDLPIILYNIPGRTAKNMEPEVIARIAELPNVVAIKEATGSMDQASRVLAETNLTVLSGDDSLTLPLLSMGGSGIVSVVGNIVPQDMLKLLAAWKAGNVAEAREWHFKLFTLCRDLLGIATNPIPIKIAMRLLGRDSGELRLPLTPLSAAEETRLKKTLVDYGLL